MMEKELPLPPKKKKTTKDASSSSSPPPKEDSTSHTIPTTGEARANLFPQFLMKLLNDQVAPDSLWWLPDGLAFGIDPIKITGDVLDHHFQKTKYSSFIRRLHNEGFRRQTRKYKKMDHLQLPEGTVVLSHELFQKDHPELLEKFYQRSPATLATTTTTAAGSSGSSNPKNASQFHQAMLAAAAAGGNNSANMALVQEAKARMEARNHHALLSSVPPKTTTGDDLAAAASVWGLQAATAGSATAGGRTHPSLDALAMSGRFGSAGMAPNLQIPFDTTTTNTATGGRLSLEELRQVRLQRELLAQQQQQQQQLLKSYQTGGLLGPSAPTTSGLSHHPYLHSGLRMNNIQPMSRSSSTESAQQKQQQQQQQQHQLDLMIQQQMLSGGVSFPSLGGSAAATAGFGNVNAATNTGMDAQVNHLRQLELETRRRRLQLEQQQHHQQQQQQQQFQRQDQQQKLSAADTLRRFTNNTSPSF